jgi:hypothetical protein
MGVDVVGLEATTDLLEQPAYALFVLSALIG